MALFARVLQYGGFSEAARRVGVPVSTLSRKIQALERSVGARLLERTTRTVSATEAGREIQPHCQQILEAMEGAAAALRQREAEVAGTLRLAAPPSLSDVLVVPLLKGFLEQYPKVQAKVLVTDRHLDMVNDEVDISLRVGPQAESSLVFRRLLRYRHVLVASPAYLAGAGKKPRQPEDLRKHRLVGFNRWFGEVTWTLARDGEVQRFPVTLAMAINDYAGVLAAAVAGMGIAEMPAIIGQQELASGQLLPVLPKWQFPEVDLAAYYMTRRHSPRPVQLFLDHCSANIERLRG
jgi:DNA-binding transcriptional LysR family regulator